MTRDKAEDNGHEPVLFVDVDGVISLFGFDSDTRPAGAFANVDGIPHYLAEGTAQRLERLAERFELVWCTGWEEKANEHLPHLLGLPGELPCLTFGDLVAAGPAHWKLAAIDAYAGPDRPVAWIDDSFDASCHAWAQARPGPTLLVATEPATGMTDAEVKRLRTWAEALPRPRPAES